MQIQICFGLILAFCECPALSLSLWGLSVRPLIQEAVTVVCLCCCVCCCVCVCALVTDLCVSSFSLPHSAHRGCSSVCQTGEHSFKSSQSSISHFASSCWRNRATTVFFPPLLFWCIFSLVHGQKSTKLWKHLKTRMDWLQHPIGNQLSIHWGVLLTVTVDGRTFLQAFGYPNGSGF